VVRYKRLDRGTFKLPEAASGAQHVEIDDATFEALLDGIDPGPAPPKRSAARRVH
jgi:IS66 Orf2 like protein